MGVGGEGLFTWEGLADLWRKESLALVLGQALSRKASQGGKAKNDKSEAQKSAVLVRGGMWPPASV